MTSPLGTDGGRRRAESRPAGRRGPSTVAWLILVVGIAVVMVGARYWDHTTDEDRSERFDEQADDVHDDVLAQLDRYNAALVATAGLFDASEVVTAPEFTLFVDRLGLTNYEGVSGLSFVAPVTTDQLDEFDTSLALLGVDDLDVHPPSSRARQDIVTYTEGDGFELGYDLATIPDSRDAMEQARDSGHTVASSFHSMPTEQGNPDADDPGFAVFTPLYQEGGATNTTEARRTALLGWLATPVASAEFVVSGIDDFGTGYSSLSYLQRFPIDTLKVDQSFVHALVGDAQSRAIVGSVISLAHSLDLTATAEGVETQGQLEVLRVLECDHVQGNLLAPPQPAASFRRLVETTIRLGSELPRAPDRS